MTRLLVPGLLIAAAIGLFVLYTNPTYQEIKGLVAIEASYDDALEKSAQLRQLRDKLLATRASFAETDVQKLSRVLPDNVDNIRLIIDINNIASRHRLTLSGVALGEAGSGAVQANTLSVGPSDSDTGEVTVGFGVSATYDDFLSFLQDLEHSLRIVDVTKITFGGGNTSLSTYAFEIRTYWLR